MKKSVKALLSLALALALMLSLGITAFAEETKTEEKEEGEEIPLEWVSYGYNLPDPALVPMHELGEEDITIDGISYDVKTLNGKIYIRNADLIAVVLLRENKDKAEELGIDYDKLYIKEGLILVKEDGMTAHGESI